MQLIRSVTFLVYQLLVTVFFAFVMLCTFPLARRTRFMTTTGWTRSVVWGARVLCGIHYRVIGRENIPVNQQVMVCSKHSSTWETLALNFLFAPGAFIAKRELLFLPFFGWGFALASPITINRKAGAEAMAQMIAQGRERVAIGFNIVIFPEGTRISAGKRGKYKTGAARLATGINKEGTRMPILPIAHNAGYLWPKKGVLKTPGTITLSILPPIDPSDWDTQALTNELERVIEAEVERLGDPRRAA
jgi:1-acyl-sn-glycerol-3-phosphate acyltransferase